MHISFNELESNYKSAFLAVGLSLGEAVDATRMLVWLDAMGASANSRVPSSLNRLESVLTPRPTIRRYDKSAVTLDCGGASILAIGSATIDMGLAEHKIKGISRLNIANVCDIEFTAGLARILLVRDCNTILRWSDYAGSSDNKLYLQNKKVQGNIPILSGYTEEIFFGDVEVDFMQKPSQEGEWSNSEQYDISSVGPYFDGITVDPERWQLVEFYAKKMLIPESEKSRIEGAGIGADED